jgi:hypothetical protein
MSNSSSVMETLPKGYHIVENSAPSVAEAARERKLSQLLDSMVASYTTASATPADLKARLHQTAVRWYLAQGLDNPSESMDDPVIKLLEKAQSLTP